MLAETTPPAVVGVLFLGDTTRRGLTGVAVAGFALAVVCAVQLARFGETAEEKAGQQNLAKRRAGRVQRHVGPYAAATGFDGQPVSPFTSAASLARWLYLLRGAA